MKKLNLVSISNVLLAIYLLAWVYYAAFNWEVFSIKLNTNAGFSIIGGYPFAFFFLLGFALLLGAKYFIHIQKLENDKNEREYSHKITILEKDIEILKMKEVLFKMQNSEMGKNSSHLNALHEKLDNLSAQLSSQDKNEEDPEAKEDKV